MTATNDVEEKAKQA